ncbi:MAG: CsgG/HfaB family protein [Elusimicrobiota bacterium]|nr:CsgG/HfaB family protein [Elusimicrobiota bacterium]
MSKEAASKGLGRAALAIFPFQTDEALAKKRINFAVSELYMEQLHKTGGFKLIERMQLDTALKEQKLGLSGAIDSETAAQVGKMIGARLLLIGSVSRMGKSYQITARLIDAESSAIIIPDVVEVPIALFEGEAARYITQVPEEGALGVYLAARYSKLAVKSMDPQTISGNTLTPGKLKLLPVSAVFGVRYWPNAKWMFDVSYLTNSYNFSSGVRVNNNTYSDGGTVEAQEGRLLINRALRSGDSFRVLAGAGISLMAVKSEITRRDAVLSSAMGDAASTIFTGILRAGVQWRPQPRLGVELLGNFNLFRRPFRQTVMSSGAVVALRKFTLPAFTPELAVSINFCG